MDVRQNLGPVIGDNSFLKTHFGNLKRNLNIGHINCTSFNLKPGSSKFSEIKNLLVDGVLNVFAVTETWLKETVSNGVVDIPGYVCLRNDRPFMRGGGVALYISTGIEYEIVYLGRNYGVVECLFAELCFGDIKVLLGVVYLPHGDLVAFENEVADLLVRYNTIVIVGDFNNNLFDPDKSRLVRDICHGMGLSLVHNSLPTYFDVQHNSTSLLDYILVSLPESVLKTKQFQCPGITRHSFISLSLQIPIFVSQNYNEYYDYNAVTLDSFLPKISECYFDEIYLTDSVDEQLKILNDNLDLLHTVVPLKRHTIRTRNDNWMNAPDIKYQISLRNIAYTTYLHSRTSENWKIFCRHRNKVKAVIRKHKRRAHSTMFENKSNRDIWNILKSNGVGSNNKDFLTVDPDVLNNRFSSNQSVSFLSNFDVSSIPNYGFSFRTVDVLEMFTAFDKIKSKAVGSDGYSLSFLRVVMPLISHYLLYLVNNIFTTSYFPTGWKLARVVPIKKSGDTMGAADLRPISVLPILSKMMEHLIKEQMLSYVEERRLLHDCQSGFRCNRSTTSLLIGLTDNIRLVLSRKGFCVLLSLDLSKAFDRVSHSLLISKLFKFYGFSRSACSLVYSYLTDRKQFVCSNHCYSNILPVFSGVPQGSVLGPLLFIMFMNDLFPMLSSNLCQPFSFADDVQLLFKGTFDFPDVLQNTIDYNVNLLSDWMSKNELSINTSKTKAMYFGDSRYDMFSVLLNGTSIEFVDRITCLGLIIDQRLSFECHINSVVSKVAFTLRKLYSMDLLLPFHLKKRIVHATIMPLFLYGLEVYSGTVGYILKKIRLAFNRVIRYLFSLRSRHHVSSYIVKFLGCNFTDFIIFRNMIHFYKTYKLQVPNYLNELFEFGRSRRNKQLLIPPLTPLLERSFSVRVSRTYNQLPAQLKEFSYSPIVYKKKLFQILSQ